MRSAVLTKLDWKDGEFAAMRLDDALGDGKADAHATGFVDVRSVPVTWPDDLADNVHPAQAWSDRITALIAKSLGA